MTSYGICLSNLLPLERQSVGPSILLQMAVFHSLLWLSSTPCLENPRDGGAWWAAVYGVAQSRTRLKQLRSSSSSRTPSCICVRMYRSHLLHSSLSGHLGYLHVSEVVNKCCYEQRGSCCCCLVLQSCPTLCDPMDYSPLDSSVYGDSPGKNTGVGCHALLQGIFQTQESNLGLPHCRQILYYLSH